jgi:hypothetical protein
MNPANPSCRFRGGTRTRAEGLEHLGLETLVTENGKEDSRLTKEARKGLPGSSKHKVG